VRLRADKPGTYDLGPLVVRYSSDGVVYRQEFDAKAEFTVGKK